MDRSLTCLRFSTCHMELMAEISIGHGIQPIKETMNGRAARCQGVGASKSGAYSRCLKSASTTASTVAMVSAVITHLDSVSRNLYPPISSMAQITTIIMVVSWEMVRPNPVGEILYRIAAHKMPTPAVFTSAENTFSTKKMASQTLPFSAYPSIRLLPLSMVYCDPNRKNGYLNTLISTITSASCHP